MRLALRPSLQRRGRRAASHIEAASAATAKGNGEPHEGVSQSSSDLVVRMREAHIGIISWIILGLIAGFIGSKLVDRRGQGFWLEPISKSSEEDNEAGELNEAEEVLGVILPADEDAALPLDPSEEALDQPASHVAA